MGVEAADFPVPDGCEVSSYDGTLMPGLVDAHVHLVADASPGLARAGRPTCPEEVDAEIEKSLAAQAAHGVTTVLDLGDRDYRTLAFRDRASPRPAADRRRRPADHDPRRALPLPGLHGGDPRRAAGGGRRPPRARRRRDQGDGEWRLPDGRHRHVRRPVRRRRPAGARRRAHEVGLRVLAHAHSITGIEAALAAESTGSSTSAASPRTAPGSPTTCSTGSPRPVSLVDPTMGFDHLARRRSMPPPPPQVAETMAALGMDMLTMLAQRFADARPDAGARGPASYPVSTPARCRSRHTATRGSRSPTWSGRLPGRGGAGRRHLRCADACGVGDVTGRLAAGYDADLLVADGDLRSTPTVSAGPRRSWSGETWSEPPESGHTTGSLAACRGGRPRPLEDSRMTVSTSGEHSAGRGAAAPS